MKIQNIYLRFCVAIVATLLLWFVVTPELFNINPILGAIIACSVQVIDYKLLYPVYVDYTKKQKEKDSQSN